MAFYIGYHIELLFPKPDPKKPAYQTMIEIILQCLVSALSIYYIRKIVRFIPFIFETNCEYKPHDIEEYGGEITIAIIFVGVQKNILNKIDILREHFDNAN